MAIKYDKDVNYQAEINKAVAREIMPLLKYWNNNVMLIAGEGIKDYSMTTTFQNYNPSPAASTPSYKPKTPSYMTGDAMAKNLGIDYNYKNILSKYDEATAAEYALKK